MNSDRYRQEIARGDALRDSGALDESLTVYQEAFLAAPAQATAPFKKGTALDRLNRPSDAETAYRQALALEPRYPEANNNLAIILAQRGDFRGAEIHYRRALAARPNYIEAVGNLGSLLASSMRADEAISLMRELLSSPAISFEEYWTLAEMMLRWGRVHDGAQFIASALQDEALQKTLSASDMAKSALLFAESGCFDGIRSMPYIFDVAEQMPDIQLRSCLLRMLTFAWTLDENIRLSRIYKRHNDMLENQPEVSESRFAPWDRLASSEPSIGFLGSLALGNNTAKFLVPVLPHLKNRGFRLRYYSTIERLPGDLVQQAVMASVDDVKWICDLSPFEVATMVYADKCTILIDLDGFSRYSKTEAFVFRPAPVQINWINWPSSLGLTSADYFLGSKHMIPRVPGLMTEIPIEMSTPFGAYTPMIEAMVRPEPPCIENGFITFGNTSHPYKLSARLIRLWADVILRVPNSRFRLVRQECADESFCGMLVNEFRRCGVAPNRLEFYDFVSLGMSHLDAYSSIDICLDSSPYGGATTAADCLWMGVPLVCLTGPGLHQRLSCSVLAALALDELICSSESQFVERAVLLAKSPNRVAEYRQTLRTRFEKSPQCNAKAVADEAIRAFNYSLDDTRKRILDRLPN
ncbi:MAG: tetratricopeptide repeat protein [Sulfuritalea sp.]|nr:tetratricopeptide repeat protein [Sulfuritalea sp.]